MAKKFLNTHIENIVEEMLIGYVYAYQNFYRKLAGYNSVIYKNHRQDKVAIVIGGGSGHEPLFAGFCGKGLADAAACGNICASPNPQLIYETAKEVNQGKGVLFIYGCYAGDNLNFDMAEGLCKENGIKTAHVRVQDDFLSAPLDRKEDRRGIAGDLFVIKIAGAAADMGLSLEEVVRITQKARDNTKTIGVAVSPGTLPGNSSPTFEMADDEMEYGMGLHGEAGVERTKLESAEIIVARMYQELKVEMSLKKNDKITVLINGLGGTPLLELNLISYNLMQHFLQDGIDIYDVEIGNYCTCMEMGGFSITFMRLDEELEKYYKMPCESAYYTKSPLYEMKRVAIEPRPVECKGTNKYNESVVKLERSKPGVLRYLTAMDVKSMLIYVAQKVIANKEYLTKIDSDIGDGDHGIGMALGMEQVLLAMEENKEKNVYNLFEKAGQSMLMSMGGASGVIFGSLYLSGAKVKEEKNKEKISGKDFLDMEKESLRAIQEVGKAQLGDKTMVDALIPAILSMEEKQEESFLEILKAAEKGAFLGMERTKNMVAKYGRAKSLKERALGFQDAGATSVYLIFQGMREFVEDKLEKF